jgi:hypothetical protein
VVRQLNRWSSRWRWVQRCQKYDDYLEYQRRLQQEKERRAMHERHARVALLGMNVAVKGLESLTCPRFCTNRSERVYITA